MATNNRLDGRKGKRQSGHSVLKISPSALDPRKWVSDSRSVEEGHELLQRRVQVIDLRIHGNSYSLVRALGVVKKVLFRLYNVYRPRFCGPRWWLDVFQWMQSVKKTKARVNRIVSKVNSSFYPKNRSWSISYSFSKTLVIII